MLINVIHVIQIPFKTSFTFLLEGTGQINMRRNSIIVLPILIYVLYFIAEFCAYILLLYIYEKIKDEDKV